MSYVQYISSKKSFSIEVICFYKRALIKYFLLLNRCLIDHLFSLTSKLIIGTVANTC